MREKNLSHFCKFHLFFVRKAFWIKLPGRSLTLISLWQRYYDSTTMQFYYPFVFVEMKYLSLFLNVGTLLQWHSLKLFHPLSILKGASSNTFPLLKIYQQGIFDLVIGADFLWKTKCTLISFPLWWVVWRHSLMSRRMSVLYFVYEGWPFWQMLGFLLTNQFSTTLNALAICS